MNSKDIILAPDGHYVDLSKVVAVSPTKSVPADFVVAKGFDIWFTPEGIPFKEDNCFKITVKKEYVRPHIEKEWRTEVGITEEGREILRIFSEECSNKMELERLAFIDSWKAWKEI